MTGHITDSEKARKAFECYMVEHICKECGTSFVRFMTTQTRCQKCTYNRYAKPRKPIKRIGKVTKKWIETRHEWIKQNPADKNGYWYCYLKYPGICIGRMDIDQLTLDHKKSRSSRPDLRFDLANLAPACVYCNNQKGSASHETDRID